MANTTSGTATFDKTFSIDEIVEEAFERIGLTNVAGYQLKSCLLYTSPSPRDGLLSRMPSSA